MTDDLNCKEHPRFINFAIIHSPTNPIITGMIVYGIPNCNTVKKSLDWLKLHQIDFEFHDFKKKGVTAEKLNEWCGVFGWENILNKKGTTWKKLTPEEQLVAKDQAGAVQILLKYTSAIKRPVVEKDGKAILLSFNEDQYRALLK